MLGAILVLLLIPFINTSWVRNTTYRPVFKIFFWLFVADFVVLMWIGQKTLIDELAFIGQIATIGYFAFFLIILPVLGRLEFYLAFYKK